MVTPGFGTGVLGVTAGRVGVRAPEECGRDTWCSDGMGSVGGSNVIWGLVGQGGWGPVGAALLGTAGAARAGGWVPVE